MLYPPRFYDEDGRLRRETFALLSLFYDDVDWFTPIDELVEMTQFLVSATTYDPATGQPAERWAVAPSGRFRKVDQKELGKLLARNGYSDRVVDMGGLKPSEVDIAVVQLGRAHSVWIKFSEIIRTWSSGQEFKKLVIIGHRDKDPRGKDVAADYRYVETTRGLKPPKGCEEYKQDAILPTDADLPTQGYERWMAKWFWANLRKPAELEDVEVEYFDSLEDYFKVYPKRVRAIYFSINPHRFQLAKFLRTAPRGSRVAFIAPSAKLARCDTQYLADAWAREILEYYIMGFRIYGNALVIPPRILEQMQEMERLARLN